MPDEATVADGFACLLPHQPDERDQDVVKQVTQWCSDVKSDEDDFTDEKRRHYTALFLELATRTTPWFLPDDVAAAFANRLVKHVGVRAAREFLGEYALLTRARLSKGVDEFRENLLKSRALLNQALTDLKADIQSGKTTAKDARGEQRKCEDKLDEVNARLAEIKEREDEIRKEGTP